MFRTFAQTFTFHLFTTTTHRRTAAFTKSPNQCAKTTVHPHSTQSTTLSTPVPVTVVIQISEALGIDLVDSPRTDIIHSSFFILHLCTLTHSLSLTLTLTLTRIVSEPVPRYSCTVRRCAVVVVVSCAVFSFPFLQLLPTSSEYPPAQYVLAQDIFTYVSYVVMCISVL